MNFNSEFYDNEGRIDSIIQSFTKSELDYMVTAIQYRMVTIRKRTNSTPRHYEASDDEIIPFEDASTYEAYLHILMGFSAAIEGYPEGEKKQEWVVPVKDENGFVHSVVLSSDKKIVLK